MEAGLPAGGSERAVRHIVTILITLLMTAPCTADSNVTLMDLCVEEAIKTQWNITEDVPVDK